MKPDEAIALLAERPQTTGVLSDFDGTLSPIVDHPDLARPVDGAVETLEQLAGTFAVVGVISGRSLDDLASRFAPQGLLLAGSYGRERSDRPGPPATRDMTPVAVRAMDAAREWPGVVVEQKDAGVALHYRRAPDRAADVDRLASALAREFGLEIRPGRMVAELTPPGPGKADALSALVTERELERFLFAGDDVADGAAFEWARSSRRRCVLVGVASAELPGVVEQNADLLVDGPEGFLVFLRRLLDRVALS